MLVSVVLKEDLKCIFLKREKYSLYLDLCCGTLDDLRITSCWGIPPKFVAKVKMMFNFPTQATSPRGKWKSSTFCDELWTPVLSSLVYPGWEVKEIITHRLPWKQHVYSWEADGTSWVAAGMPEVQDACRVDGPLLSLPLSQWQDLQDHGRGDQLQQGSGSGENSKRAKENGSKKSETECLRCSKTNSWKWHWAWLHSMWKEFCQHADVKQALQGSSYRGKPNFEVWNQFCKAKTIQRSAAAHNRKSSSDPIQTCGCPKTCPRKGEAISDEIERGGGVEQDWSNPNQQTSYSSSCQKGPSFGSRRPGQGFDFEPSCCSVKSESHQAIGKIATSGEIATLPGLHAAKASPTPTWSIFVTAGRQASTNSSQQATGASKQSAPTVEPSEASWSPENAALGEPLLRRGSSQMCSWTTYRASKSSKKGTWTTHRTSRHSKKGPRTTLGTTWSLE